MSKSTTALTNTQVKQSKPKVKEYKLSDGDGLQLRIKPTGSRSWIFNTTNLIQRSALLLALVHIQRYHWLMLRLSVLKQESY
jgi:hypothetical protein